MTDDLFTEIMDGINARVFTFEINAAEARLKYFIEGEKYFVFVALNEKETSNSLGFVSIYENYSLYAGGAFGTIPELYVRPAYLS